MSHGLEQVPSLLLQKRLTFVEEVVLAGSALLYHVLFNRPNNVFVVYNKEDREEKKKRPVINLVTQKNQQIEVSRNKAALEQNIA